MSTPSRRDLLASASQNALAGGLIAGLASAARAVDLAPPDKQPPNLKLPKPPGKKVGFAVVGLGELALSQILPAFRDANHCKPVALVSGHADKAKAVAE